MKAFPSTSAQILLAVLFTVISVLGVSSIIELNVLKQRETRILQDKGTLTADRLANSLAYPLWNLHREETERVVLEELRSANVLRIQVFDEDGALYVGKVRGDDGAVRDIAVTSAGAATIPNVATFSFSRPVNFKNTGIGRVTLDVTDAALITELRSLRRGIAIKLMVLVVLLSVVLFVALRVLVIRPVAALESWVETIPSVSADHVPVPRFRYFREIDSLAEAFANLSLNLRRKNQELESEHGRLRELNRQMRVEIDERKRAEESLRHAKGVSETALEERKRAEDALRLSEHRYRKIVDLAPEAIVVVDTSTGHFVSFNPQALKLFKLSADEILKVGPAEMSSPLQPDGRPTSDAALSFTNKALAGECPVFEWMHRNSLGEDIPCEVRLLQLPDESRALVRGTITDITDRKREEQALRASEERFSKAFSLAPQRMSITRISDGMVLYVNDRWVRESGFSREDIVNQSIFDLNVWLGDEERSWARRLLEEGKSFQNIEGRLRTKTGEERVALASAEVIELNGEPCMLWASSDITERKQIEDALRASQDRLRALSARLQSAREEEGMRIAREIHDELGGVMTGLKWDLEGIDKVLSKTGNGRVVSPVREKLQAMTRQIESTIGTVRRISSDLRPGMLDDLGLVAAIDWQAQQFQARTGVKYHSQMLLETVDLNRESATAVFRIFQEILTNVLRHSQAKNFYVNLREQNGYLELEVRDDGCGITESQIMNTRSLGLLGMKERALLVSGEVDISGASEQGTTVVVRVPLAA